MSINDEREINSIQEMLRLVEDVSELPTWGFKESYRSVTDERLIYDSEWCRLKLVWGGWDYGSGNSISIYYGRLHAPNEKTTMIWNDEEHHAWHELGYALHFLDGRSPADASELGASHPLTNKYYEDEITKKYHRRQPEWLMQMHMEIWNHYGEKLFGLFDLQQPKLWKEYQNFLKKVYDIEGRPSFIEPPLDKVC